MGAIKKTYIAFLLTLWITLFISLFDGTYATLDPYWQYGLLIGLFVLTLLAKINLPNDKDDVNPDDFKSTPKKPGGRPLPPPSPNMIRQILSYFYEFEDEKEYNARKLF